MIKVVFFLLDVGNSQKRFSGFEVSGHAFFDERGRDIVCAAVSSAVFMTINGITDVLKLKAEVCVSKKRSISVVVCGSCVEDSQNILKILECHLLALQERYGDYLSVDYTEV